MTAQANSAPVAIYVASTSNAKLSRPSRRDVDTTYTSIEASCPSSCEWKGAGCYGQSGPVAFTTRRLDRAAAESNAGPLEAARAEAAAIDQSYHGGRVPSQWLRLHTVGDCSTAQAVRLVASAVRRWRRRGGLGAWTYTHAWRTLPHSLWQGVSVLASVATPEDADAAKAKGYAPALVVARFPEGGKVFALPGSVTKWIPCPAQTGDKVCSECRACFDADRLTAKNYGIAFEAHGADAPKVRRRLAVLQGGVA